MAGVRGGARVRVSRPPSNPLTMSEMSDSSDADSERSTSDPVEVDEDYKAYFSSLIARSKLGLREGEHSSPSEAIDVDVLDTEESDRDSDRVGEPSEPSDSAPVSVDESNVGVSLDGGVANRTRSRFKALKPDRAASPVCLELEDSSSSSSSSSSSGCGCVGPIDVDNVGPLEGVESGAEAVRVGIERGRGKERKGRMRKRKRGRPVKGDFIFESLVNSMWKLKGVSPEPPVKDGSVVGETNPIAKLGRRLFKFEFGIEKPKPVEKTEAEKEEDELWGLLDFVKRSEHVGSFDPMEAEAQEASNPQYDADSSAVCDQGKHHFILDEEIGIVCSFCSFVKQKIRYILPSFAMRPQLYSGQTAAPKEKDLPSLEEFGFATMDECVGGSSSMSKGTVWDVIPGIKETMFPHQQEGLEFIWKNLAGSILLEELKVNPGSNDGGGCVISHAPGTGKTRLAIVFLQTYMAVFPECRPLIIAPTAMLSTWEKQFMTWEVDIPIHILNKREFSGKEDKKALEIVRNQPRNENLSRLAKLYSWRKSKSVLCISYDLFKLLVDDSYDKEEQEIRKILLEMPDILVLDEGHAARNRNSQIWNSLKRIKTERRIILSGTPFQNNFDELYNMLCIVRSKFHRPAHNSVEKLRLLMESFVHVHNGAVLENLPGLRDCLVIMDPLPQQKRILEIILKMQIKDFLALEYAISLVSIHPSLLTSSALYKKVSSIDKDHLEMQRPNPNEGVKTRFVMELVRFSEATNEKVLVFSQYIEPLILVKEHLLSHFNWTEGKEVLQMDGTISNQSRQKYIDLFNDPASEAKVLLASIKACSEGINLVGASRVVLLDIVWNPAVEWQAISRAYRIGQEKVVHTYTLITSEVWECEKYKRQAEKYRLSKLVFSSKDEHNAAETNSMSVSQDQILEMMVEHEKFKNIFKRIYYRPKEYLLDGFDRLLG